MNRVLLLFLLAFAGIIVPFVVVFLAGLLGPPPYLLRAAPAPAGQLSERRTADGVQVRWQAFATAAEARAAAKSELRSLPTSSRSSALHQLRYRRVDNQLHGLLLPVDRMLLQLEGPSREAIDAALQQLPEITANPRRNLVWTAATTYPWPSVAVLLAYSGVYLLALSHAGSWAGSISAQSVQAVPAPALRERLLAINALDSPILVTELSPQRLQVDWRIADARWISLMQAGGLQQAHRIVLEIDPQGQTVRAIDQSWRVDWSAEVGRLRAGASFFRGIAFTSYQRGAAYGLLLNDAGQWQLGEAYDYRFDLTELKQPLIAATVESGWHWKPVVSFARWLGG